MTDRPGKSAEATPAQEIRTHAVRLHPGADVRRALQQWVETQAVDAAVVLGAVGSLRAVQIRFANQSQITELQGPHEVLSLSGTLGRSGMHLHLMVSDADGRCRGGHLSPGCEVFTTLELVIGVLPGFNFQRSLDPQTGCSELVIHAAATDHRSGD